MYFLFDKLCREIGNKKKIVIYGAGYYAREIYGKFCTIGWKGRIKYFVVTSVGIQSEFIDEIPVVGFEDEILDDDEICLLVAVGDAYIKEIRPMLEKLSSEQVLYLWDYRVSADKKIKNMLNCSLDRLCQCALDEYIWENSHYLNDKEKIFSDMKAALNRCKKRRRLEKSIVYVLEEETARDIKIIKALLENKYRVTVLRYKRKEQYVAEKELYALGVVVEQFGCMWEFILKSLKYRPMLYFFDAETTFEYALAAVRHKDIWEKNVIAPYETFTGSFIGLKEQMFECEKYCLENADAVVWRYFSKEYLHTKMGFQYRGDSIQLLDNCGGYETETQAVKSFDNKLRLCCVVSQVASFLQQDETPYTRLARFVDLLGRLDASCELHVFAWSASADEEQELKQLEQEYLNFKYFLRVEHNDLIRSLGSYDYGLCVYTNEKIPEYPMGAEKISGGIMCTEGTYRYSVANRYFDYIDAELAVITTLPEKLCDYLQQYDVVIRMNSENLDLDYLRTNRMYYKERAKAAKKELLMSKQISKLIDLFERVCSDKGVCRQEG